VIGEVPGCTYTAFETGDLDAKRCRTGTAALETRLTDLHEQDRALVAQLARQAPTTPDAAKLAAVADQLEAHLPSSTTRIAHCHGQ
jgi:hypothetical protein